MQAFRIKRLRVSGAGKIDGIIEFNDGLNIILGRSNTGKTWILKSIYYLFSSNKRPFSSLTGYTEIEGVFITKRYGEIIIKRHLDDKQAEVICDHPDVENGMYGTSYKENGPLYLNDLWIRIIGLDETIMIPKSSRYARERISWTNLANVFWVDEEEILKPESIIIKDSRYETAVISSLYFLLTGDYKKDVEEILKPEIATKTKEAVVKYIDDQVMSLSTIRSDYLLQLEKMSNVDAEFQIEQLTENIDEIQNELSELMKENTEILQRISRYQQKDATCRVLIERYQALISQYKADLQRLDFISKGEKAISKIETNDVCPFCGGPIENHEKEYQQAIQAETKRIISEIAIIMATENDLLEEQKDIAKKIQDLDIQHQMISEEISSKNIQISDYKHSLKKYKDYAKLESGIEIVNTQLSALREERVSALKKKKIPPLYHPKKEFEDFVGDEFDKMLNKILRDCNYLSAYASWDFKKFDILLDGVSKEEDQGKGYRSFLNSVVALMLYEYFNKDNVFIKTGLLFIDTPLLGFDENEDGIAGKTLKQGLYNYFINHVGDGQIIIVDNIKDMPDIDFEAAGVKVTTYYKDEKNGHTYGFMPSWRKDLPKENK